MKISRKIAGMSILKSEVKIIGAIGKTAQEKRRLFGRIVRMEEDGTVKVV